MVVDSLKFPTKGEDGMMRAIIGGGLLLASAIIPLLPQLIVNGYSLQSMRAGARNNPNPPEFEDWESLLKDGALMFGVTLVYTLIPVMLLFGVLFLGFFVFSFGAAAGSAAGEGGAAAGGGIGLIVMLLLGGLAFLLLMLAYYLMPAALVGVATEEEFMAAFDFDSVREIAFTSDYFVALVVAAVVNFLAFLVIFPLMFLLVGFPLAFIMQAGIFHYLGTVARDIATTGTGGPRTSEPHTGDAF
ncbi:DUF4013 domain-containing protein [Haloarchaeobius litoreus]|uniref:DUF4013 domain-containing protein n=1 Tax=Haloarchaeobius litoreus TaxID=755306 RepID=A0ABD6DLR4_9EURY|nr:DUF4013 domain-containing protein [Haloarchaeobius litoreus]